MKDELIIASALNDRVRIRAVSTTGLCEEARKCHDLYPASCAALGRTMSAALLIASDLKSPEEHVSVRIDGGGPAGRIGVEADGQGNVRGFIGDPHVYFYRESDGKIDVGRAVGSDGSLTVSRDMGLKEPFTGVVKLRSGEIADDFAWYFAVSEQTPSVVALGVLVETDLSVRAAGGMIIQLLPDAGEEVISEVEKTTAAMKPMSAYIDGGKKPEEIILGLFPDAVIMEKRDVRWHCDCSRERFADALVLVAEDELEKLIEEDKGAEIVCQYCSKKYQFSEDDLKAILERRRHVEDRNRLD